MAKKPQSQLPTSGESLQDIERIRQIIFGPQIREYQQHFQTLERDLARLQQELDRLNQQVVNQDNDHQSKLQNLRQEVRQSDDDIRQEVRQVSQQLGNDKVDRVALGELFVSLGEHLKTGGALADLAGTSLAKLFNDMTDSAE